MIGINTNGYPAAKLKEVMDKEQLPWRSYVDSRGEEGGMGIISSKWNLQGTPTLFLIDHRGVIRNRWLGSPGDAAIDAAIEGLVKEAEGKTPSR